MPSLRLPTGVAPEMGYEPLLDAGLRSPLDRRGEHARCGQTRCALGGIEGPLAELGVERRWYIGGSGQVPGVHKDVGGDHGKEPLQIEVPSAAGHVHHILSVLFEDHGDGSGGDIPAGDGIVLGAIRLGPERAEQQNVVKADHVLEYAACIPVRAWGRAAPSIPHLPDDVSETRARPEVTGRDSLSRIHLCRTLDAVADRGAGIVFVPDGLIRWRRTRWPRLAANALFARAQGGHADDCNPASPRRSAEGASASPP